MSVLQRANEMAEAGNPADAFALLREAQSRGEAEGFFAEGLWLLEGRFVPRDLVGARASLAKAAEAGHLESARILSALIGRGVGTVPDWQGALDVLERCCSSDPLAERQLQLLAAMDLAGDCPPKNERSQSPRIVRVEQFLSNEECAFLIELAEPRMKRSMVYNEIERRFIEDPFRTSDLAAFPVVFEWPFVHAINRRIARATETPVECGEPLQILRYGLGQEYRPHCDSSAGMENPRAITAIIWLNDDFEGGETHFDQLGLTEHPRRGDLLFFANVSPDGSPDLTSRHAGMPVTRGTKYLASRWIRTRPWQEQGLGVRALMAAQA